MPLRVDGSEIRRENQLRFGSLSHVQDSYIPGRACFFPSTVWKALVS